MLRGLNSSSHDRSLFWRSSLHIDASTFVRVCRLLERTDLLDFHLDLADLCNDNGIQLVAPGMKIGENLNRLVPPVLTGQPTRRAWDKRQTGEENHSRNHLQAPGQPKGDISLEERSSRRHIVHNQDLSFR